MNRQTFKLAVFAIMTLDLLFVGITKAENWEYETNMGWTKDNGGILLLSPVNGPGPDVTVSFTCDRGYNVVDGIWTGLGYHHNSGSGNPRITMIFSHDVEQVELTIGDLDTVERLTSMVPIPNDVYDDNGYLYISGNSVRTSANNVIGNLIYDKILSTDSLNFTFQQQLSNLALSDLKFSVVPEPATIGFLGLGSLALLKRR